MAAERIRAPAAVATVPPPERPWGAGEGDRPSAWPTEPQRDLLRAALMGDERGVAAWRRIRDSIEPETLDGAPATLLPHVARNLRSQGVDDPRLALFDGVRRYTWARNQFLIARCMPIIAELERAGIATALLKGAAFTREGFSGLRGMADVDVLVPPEARGAAVDLLTARSLRPIDPLPARYLADYGAEFRHSANFAADGGVEFDVHWGLLQDAPHPALAREALAAAQPLHLRGVQTRILCPADELLVALVHGHRYHPTPSYRWLLDAALLLRGTSGTVDLGRLVRLARRHRLDQIVRVGLTIVRRLELAEVPAAVTDSLRRPAPLRRIEERALLRPSSTQNWVERVALRQMADVRRHVSPGRPVSPLVHLRLARARSGAQVGPGRPRAFNQAAIGTGTVNPPPTPWGTRIDLADYEVVRAHCRYGLWLPEAWGCWIAGREAALTVRLPEPARGPIVMELGIGGAPATDQRVEVWAGACLLAEFTFDALVPNLNAAHLRLEPGCVSGERLELRFRASRTMVPLTAGQGEDHRAIGGALTFLTLRPYGWPSA